MTPKESLLNDFDCIVKEYTASRQETRRMLKYYAIGKWVPIEERLPEFDDGKFMGWVRFSDGTIQNDVELDCVIQEYASHWLELDLPEVES